MASSKVLQTVTPAKAGVQKSMPFLDSGFRRNDAAGRFFYFLGDFTESEDSVGFC
jgi:hypothetical protein